MLHHFILHLESTMKSRNQDIYEFFYFCIYIYKILFVFTFLAIKWLLITNCDFLSITQWVNLPTILGTQDLYSAISSYCFFISFNYPFVFLKIFYDVIKYIKISKEKKKSYVDTILLKYKENK